MCYNIFTVLKKVFERKPVMNKYLDAEKALEVIVYISHKTDDLFHIVKTIYYADKLHLENYGQLMTGDFYVAMEDGPVPSGAYDLIKYVRKDEFYYEAKIKNAHPEEAIKVQGNSITPRRAPKLDYLSESDIECLNKAIELYAEMDGGLLYSIAHNEKSYNKAGRNKKIPLTDIIMLDLPNGKDVLDYLNA
jgi:uncharacterized phage-associated protein